MSLYLHMKTTGVIDLGENDVDFSRTHRTILEIDERHLDFTQICSQSFIRRPSVRKRVSKSGMGMAKCSSALQRCSPIAKPRRFI